jgi:RHS repeat-associated protein
MYNAISGETVTYTYDSLNRLATANGSGWGEAYTIDPFGNLTAKTVTAGSGPSLSVSVNTNNQIQGLGSYDANGNSLSSPSGTALAYDVENRVSGVGWYNDAPQIYYSSDAQNKRIFIWNGTLDSNNNPTEYSVVAYSPMGQKLATYELLPGQSYQGHAAFMSVTLLTSDQYFGGRRLAAMDQLGSVGTFYPWGEAKGGTNPQDTWSYATYWRDSATGLDYASNRYYSSSYGRFMTPDAHHAHRRIPQSWNKYGYVLGDPVNANDPSGLDLFFQCADGCGAGGGGGGGDDDNDDDDDDDDDGGSGNPCVGEDGFTPNPSPYCQSDGPPPPAPAPAQPAPTPQCDVKEQFAPVPGTFHAGVHTYLDVEIDGAWSVLEATFSGSNPFSKNAQMDALVTAGLGGGLTIDHPAKDTTVWDAQSDATQLTAEQLRNDAQSIMNAATAFQQNHAPGSAGAVPYNLFGNNGIPNSNSFVRYLLTFAPDFGTVPHSKRARGWSNLILGR